MKKKLNLVIYGDGSVKMDRAIRPKSSLIFGSLVGIVLITYINKTYRQGVADGVYNTLNSIVDGSLKVDGLLPKSNTNRD